VQKTVIDTLQKEGKPQKVIAKEVGCTQSAASRHINRNLCGRKRCTSSRDDRSLERIVRKRPFKCVGELHNQRTEALELLHQELPHSFKCRIPLVKLLNKQRQKCLTWAKEKMNCSVTQ